MCCNLAFREVDWHKWVEDLVNMVDAKCVCVCCEAAFTLAASWRPSDVIRP